MKRRRLTTFTLWLSLASCDAPTKSSFVIQSHPTSELEDPKPAPVIAESPTVPDSTPRLSNDALQARIRSAIGSTQTLSVDASDPLGEGEGYFDEDPRVPSDRIDCMTWVQWVLALAYSGPDSDPLPWLDALRYYDLSVGFDTRKHYVDRWLSLEPGPMIPVDIPPDIARIKDIHLDLDTFLEHHRYPCRLHESERTQFRLHVIPQDQLMSTISTLKDGFYILFGVASERYIELYGEQSGPMGQVHPAILEVTDQSATVHHASTALEQVASVTLEEWIYANRRLHRASTIYSLKSSWSPTMSQVDAQPSSGCSMR